VRHLSIEARWSIYLGTIVTELLLWAVCI